MLTFYNFFSLFLRHQDVHNRVFSMVLASSRWLGVRADALCSVLITAVALMVVFLSQNPGMVLYDG